MREWHRVVARLVRATVKREKRGDIMQSTVCGLPVLGMMTVTGLWNIDWDGYSLGTVHKSKRFYITSEGFVRDGLLYKTQDYRKLVKALNIVGKAKVTITYQNGAKVQDTVEKDAR